MAQNKQDQNKYVKKETMLMVAFITFTAGFLAGIAYGIFKDEPRQAARVEQRQATQPATGPDFSSKIAALELEVAQNPTKVGSWIQLGNLYFDTNKYDRAIMAYKKSLELNPQNADVWTDMGVMYRRSGQPAEAIKAFDKAIEINPRHEISRFNKGIVLLHDLNDQENAIRAWEELIKINPIAMAPTGQSVDQLVVQLKNQKKSQ
ncbi:MAG: tetratricopeptide repeat protein [Deltaproteobacteria bacterium]|nr:MAG: tetratricopeptide repeat protein [Deltaproteobacteria bacterium]